MVPCLGGVVKDGRFDGVACRHLDHRFGRLAGKTRCLLSQRIGLLHISGVVLVVVKPHGVRTDDRGQGILTVGQRLHDENGRIAAATALHQEQGGQGTGHQHR
jgi:hypothetical protein